jgi:hypothetical protein
LQAVCSQALTWGNYHPNELAIRRRVADVPRVCTVCAHDDRGAIDQALVLGQPLRDIARRHGPSKDALARHARAHVSPALAVVRREREEQGARTLLDRLEDLYRRADRILEAAELDAKPTLMLSAVRELRGLIEVIGKATGEIAERPQVVVNVLGSGEWLKVRCALLAALATYPDARALVASRLLELEDAS